MKTLSNTDLIIFTDYAIEMIIQNRIEREINYALKLRIGIQSGGCAGISYQLGFDNTKLNDLSVETPHFTYIVDKAHVVYIRGLEIDYEIDEFGGVFRFKNPNAVTKCPCGTSFNIIKKTINTKTCLDD